MNNRHSTSRPRNRMYVERAGNRGAYLPGWFVYPEGSGQGEHFDTWAEAMAYAIGGPLVSEATA